MAMALADPQTLDRLAKSLEAKANKIPTLKRQAKALNVEDKVAGLTQIGTWADETARDLRKRAKVLRTPEESPFKSLSAFGIPSGAARNDEERRAAAKKFNGFIKSLDDGPKGDDPKARAAKIKEYFEALSPSERGALAAAEPKRVGNLDGVPVRTRYAANRISIQKQFTKENEHFKNLSKSDPSYERTKDRVETLKKFMAPRFQTITDPDTMRKTKREVPRQFLVFDPDHGSAGDPKASPMPDGRVAEVVGDLEGAANVAYRVPGITNRLDNFESFSKGGYDLAADEKRGVEQQDTAVVNWLGYDTPELGDSADPTKAETGGKQLSDFQKGISVNLKSDAVTSIFAHSYGTLATSKALQKGMKAKNVTFMGSPGLGSNINSVSDFNMPNTNFYALRAPKDYVSYTQGHGKDPADFEDITRLSTEGADGHSQYYDPSTDSLSNLQGILFRNTGELETTDTSLDEELKGAPELRKLVGFIQSKVPPEVVKEMGGELDPILQDVVSGRIKFTEAILPLNRVLNRHDMLDHVKPHELTSEVVSLAKDFAYRETYKALKAKGLPDWAAKATAYNAGAAAGLSASAAVWPLTKILEYNRLQGNIKQLTDSLADGGKRIADHGSKAADAIRDARNDTGSEIVDTFRNPTHAWNNAGDVSNSFKENGGKFVDETSSMIDAGLDTGDKALNKGKDVLDSAKNLLS